MIAEIICVGTELLLGDIVNTNAQYLAQELAHLGIAVHYQTVVGDNPGRIKSALAIAFSRADTVITTGGLGPTKDDLTKEIVAEYFHKSLVCDEQALTMLEERLRKFGTAVLSASNRKQAFVPAGAIVLYNDCGTAPGCIIEDNGQAAIVLPGPPKEMKPMFQKCVDRYLSRRSERTFVSVMVKLQGIGESAAADRVGDLLDGTNPTVAPYAKEDGVTLRVTASAPNREEAVSLIQPIVTEIRKRLGEHIIGVGEPT